MPIVYDAAFTDGVPSYHRFALGEMHRAGHEVQHTVRDFLRQKQANMDANYGGGGGGGGGGGTGGGGGGGMGDLFGGVFGGIMGGQQQQQEEENYQQARQTVFGGGQMPAPVQPPGQSPQQSQHADGWQGTPYQLPAQSQTAPTGSISVGGNANMADGWRGLTSPWNPYPSGGPPAPGGGMAGASGGYGGAGAGGVGQGLPPLSPESMERLKFEIDVRSGQDRRFREWWKTMNAAEQDQQGIDLRVRQQTHDQTMDRSHLEERQRSTDLSRDRFDYDRQQDSMTYLDKVVGDAVAKQEQFDQQERVKNANAGMLSAAVDAGLVTEETAAKLAQIVDSVPVSTFRMILKDFMPPDAEDAQTVKVRAGGQTIEVPVEFYGGGMSLSEAPNAQEVMEYWAGLAEQDAQAKAADAAKAKAAGEFVDEITPEEFEEIVADRLRFYLRYMGDWKLE